jgi:hypothetical protein
LFNISLSFTHRSEECDFIGYVPVIDIVRQPVDCLKNLIFNAHHARLAETEAVRNAGK